MQTDKNAENQEDKDVEEQREETVRNPWFVFY